MKAYDYSVVIRVKNKINTIVEYNDFSRIVDFVNAVSKNECDKFYDCTVEIFKNYDCTVEIFKNYDCTAEIFKKCASITSVMITSYKMQNTKEVVRAALMVK